MFYNPILKESDTLKEVSAVNSEFEIDLSKDEWKIKMLLSTMCKENHPMNIFTVGNYETLNRPGAVDALNDYFNKYYSSNRMALTVYS